MKNKQLKSGGGLTVIIAALCIVVYLFALVQAVVRLYFSIEQCQVTAYNDFIKLRAAVISAGTQGFMDDRFVQTVKKELESSKILEAMIITGPDGEYPFEKQRGSAVKYENNSPRFIVNFTKITYSEPLPIQNIRNTNINVLASAFDFKEISKILLQTLFLILIGFSVSFFTMMIQTLLDGKNQGKKIKTVPAAASQDYSARFAAPPVPSVAQPELQPITENTQARHMPVFESGPKGLYSARSNMGWEEYTKDRLDAEIHRCASSEKDLTFMTIEFYAALNENIFKEITEDASTILSTKDMLFEYGVKGFYAILPGIDLDSAIGKSEKFYQRIKMNHPECELNMGLTSRSGRLLNASRLMLESKEALQRAKNDPSTSIIAFKSDPEKYRAYISQQG